MTAIIWILKGFIALLFTITGVSKLVLPKTQLLAQGMHGLVDLDEKQIKMTGFLEILGALGLILPSLFNIFSGLSAIASLCLGLTMIVAGWIHIKLNLSVVPNIAIFVVCILIAYWELAQILG